MVAYLLTLHLYAYFMMNWWSRHSIIRFGKNVILMVHTFLKSLFEFRARTNKKLFHYIYLCRFLFCNHLMFTHFAPFFSFIELSMREQKVYTFELFEKQHCILFYNYITMWIARFVFSLKINKRSRLQLLIHTYLWENILKLLDLLKRFRD